MKKFWRSRSDAGLGVRQALGSAFFLGAWSTGLDFPSQSYSEKLHLHRGDGAFGGGKRTATATDWEDREYEKVKGRERRYGKWEAVSSEQHGRSHSPKTYLGNRMMGKLGRSA